MPAIGAVEFAKEFKTEKEAAAKKYAGKQVVVEGTVKYVSVGGSNAYAVLNGYQNPNPKKDEIEVPMDVQCIVEPPLMDKTLLLSKGQKVKIKGTYAEVVGGFAIVLGSCVLLEVGPDPAIAVTAAQLTKDWASDMVAAKKKYEDKPVIVEGVALGDDKDNQFLLEGTGKDLIAAKYPSELKEVFRAIKKGQKVKIKGVCSSYYGNTVTVVSAVVVK